MQRYIRYLISLLPSLFFCLRILPFSQAIRIPIFIHKMKALSLRGGVKIDSECIYMGMIKLGYNLVPLYKDTGIMLQNDGMLIFKGKCAIGSGSSISIGGGGVLIFGENFGASAEFRLVCNHSITFGRNDLFGYECLIMDNDLHQLTSIRGFETKAYGPVKVGDYNWFGARCTVLKNTTTPSYCTVAAGSILVKSYMNFGEYKVIGGNADLRILKSDVYRDPDNDDMIIK